MLLEVFSLTLPGIIYLLILYNIILLMEIFYIHHAHARSIPTNQEMKQLKLFSYDHHLLGFFR